MSRSQQQQVLTTAENNSSADQTAATTAQTAENADLSDYEGQLSKLASSDPFKQGGQFDTATDQKLSGVADAGSAALTDSLQTQAQRTGQNAGAANATSAEAARANQRQLSSDEAGATQTRIGDEANYSQQVVSDTAVPAQIEAGTASSDLSAANGALNTASSSAQTPGFWDTLGSSFAKGLGSLATGGNSSSGGSGNDAEKFLGI